MVAPRPTSNNSRSFPASTSVAAPNRSVAGNGTPVPSSVTLKSCAQTAHVYAAELTARHADKIAKRRVMPISRLHGCVPGERAYRATACGVKWLAVTGGRCATLRLRRLRAAFAAVPLPPRARSLPRHLPPARCSAQTLWFDLQALGLADG